MSTPQSLVHLLPVGAEAEPLVKAVGARATSAHMREGGTQVPAEDHTAARHMPVVLAPSRPSIEGKFDIDALCWTENTPVAYERPNGTS